MLSGSSRNQANSRYSLAPKYEELAQLYSSVSKKITIAKVDATLNDVPDEIQGFPTIKLYAAGKKDSPVDYAGSRTVEDLIEFIRDNGSYKIDGNDLADSDDVDADFAKATEGMPQQAMAASKSASGAADYVTDAVKDAAHAAETFLADDDADADHHDEL